MLTVPYGVGEVSGSFLLDAPFGGFKDENNGFSDLVITPVLGWHEGNFHYSASLSIFAPTGKYNTASVSLSPPGLASRPALPKSLFPWMARRRRGRRWNRTGRLHGDRILRHRG